ncbi:MAG: hypothetical protein HC880_04650 [Bacteroidia bacterium]|nr:hypothetical protein [Bacteroidia bacterium]
MNTQAENKELVFIYNQNKRFDKTCLARVKSLNVRLNEINLAKEPVTATQIKELADKIGIPVHSLINAEMVEELSPSRKPNC